MAGLTVTVEDTTNGIYYDVTRRLRSCRASKGEHGDLRLAVELAMGRDEAYAVMNLVGVPKVVISDGCRNCWSGRLEDIAPTESGLSFTALGPWRYVSDLVYTALWSDASVKNWDVLTEEDISTIKKSQFDTDNNNRLWLAARNGEGFVNTNRACFGYRIPDMSDRGVTVVQFVYDLGSGTNWTGKLQSRDSSWGSAAAQWTLAGGIAVKTGAIFVTFTAAEALTFDLEATGTLTIAANTGSAAYLKITRLRVATSTANCVDTTYGSGITAGARTITPVSMAGIYEGMDLVITGGGGTSEMVTVTGVTGSTFDATFAKTHTATVTIKGIVVYGDEIVKDILSGVNNLNAGVLSSSTILIQSPGVDMVDVMFEDRKANTVLDDIAARGDGLGNVWESGVRDEVLYLRPRGSDDEETWAVDADVFSIERSLELLANDVQAVYKRPDEKLKRADRNQDSFSAEVYGLNRQKAVDVHTTQTAEAEKVRDQTVSVGSIPAPSVSLAFQQLFTATGTPADKTLMEPSDVVIARNLPPTLDVPPDNDVAFRVTRLDWDLLRDGLTVEVAARSLVNQLAGVNTDRPVVNGQRKPFLIAAKG